MFDLLITVRTSNPTIHSLKEKKIRQILVVFLFMLYKTYSSCINGFPEKLDIDLWIIRCWKGRRWKFICNSLIPWVWLHRPKTKDWFSNLKELWPYTNLFCHVVHIKPLIGHKVINLLTTGLQVCTSVKC